jgi:hypothetical protein
MFLLNSPACLVSVPCNRAHTNTTAGTPSTKDTGLTCRFPLPRVIPYTPKPTQLGHQCRFWVRTLLILQYGFFNDSRTQPNPHTRAIPSLTCFSSLRDSTRLFLLDTAMTVLGLSGSVTQYCLRYRTYNSGTRISTRFPFHHAQLRVALGPTNPQLTNSAEEPWPIRRQGFSPCFAATVSRILIPGRST